MRDYYKQLPDDGASPLTPYLQARLQLYDRREEPARLLFEAALHRDQQFYPAQLALGQLWRGVDKLAFAQQWLRKAAANPRARPEAQRALAEVSMEMGLWGDAVRCYEAYFAASPHDFDSKRTYLSLVLYKVPKQLEDAERIVDELLRSQPDDLRLRMDRGAVYWRQGKLEAAATEYRAVLRADPKQARAALNLGNLFYEHGQRAPAGPPRRDALVRARTAYRYYRSLDTTDDAFDWFDFKLAVPVRLQRIAAELGAGGPGPARWQDI
jgi:predicted Zn-dependent protease